LTFAKRQADYCAVRERFGSTEEFNFFTLNPSNVGVIFQEEVIFKNSVRTAKKTQHFAITKIKWLMLFLEIIAVCSENHTKPITLRAKCRVTNIKAGGRYKYHSALKY
jgi:hypothetical protein